MDHYTGHGPIGRRRERRRALVEFLLRQQQRERMADLLAARGDEETLDLLDAALAIAWRRYVHYGGSLAELYAAVRP